MKTPVSSSRRLVTSAAEQVDAAGLSTTKGQAPMLTATGMAREFPAGLLVSAGGVLRGLI
jgi:hypothetical protein